MNLKNIRGLDKWPENWISYLNMCDLMVEHIGYLAIANSVSVNDDVWRQSVIVLAIWFQCLWNKKEFHEKTMNTFFYFYLSCWLYHSILQSKFGNAKPCWDKLLVLLPLRNLQLFKVNEKLILSLRKQKFYPYIQWSIEIKTSVIQSVTTQPTTIWSFLPINSPFWRALNSKNGPHMNLNNIISTVKAFISDLGTTDLVNHDFSLHELIE